MTHRLKNESASKGCEVSIQDVKSWCNQGNIVSLKFSCIYNLVALALKFSLTFFVNNFLVDFLFPINFC